MKYWQYLIKVGRIRKKKKKIEKYFISSCLRELKMKINFYCIKTLDLDHVTLTDQICYYCQTF